MPACHRPQQRTLSSDGPGSIPPVFSWESLAKPAGKIFCPQPGTVGIT